MALNIKDPDVDQLAAELAALTGESKTGAVRTALRERRDRLAPQESKATKHARFMRRLGTEVWPKLPPEERGRTLSKDEEERILGIGPAGC